MSLDVSYELEEDQEVDDITRKGRHVRSFQVELTNCHYDTYQPGQLVEGHVVLDIDTPLYIRGVVLRYCGTTDIYWTERRLGSSTKCVDTVAFDAHEEYFHVREPLLQPGDVVAGETRLPFRFRLAPPLPENFEDNLCRIEYFVEATLKLDNNAVHNRSDRKAILVSDPTDLNKIIIPDVTYPVRAQKTFQPRQCLCCCWRHEPIVAFLRLVRAGYAPGETVHVQADVENNSTLHISDVKFVLYEERVYKTKFKTHVQRDDITWVSGGSVKPCASREWPDVPLLIPKYQMFNVTASNIFTIRHRLEMVVLKGRLVVTVEVVLGAVPLSNRDVHAPPLARVRAQGPQGQVDTVAQFHRRTSGQESRGVGRATSTNDSGRQRRKDRNRRVYPDDVIDSKMYTEHIKLKQNSLRPPFHDFQG
ncbi:arrestin domain-containing protein 3-like [Mya arenaria]|uniref:arrestin domain-containing protein 3-like n=1 Tax=Mya arenaria TaxID=6604 RepID=UPI0022E2FB19|nr:arrestin domain-containing protein 3-like [Mya arenaria]XP_052766817.1 arrestin domain-containing protein 3-like [Mya arenaria]